MRVARRGRMENLIAQLLKDFETGRMDRRQLIRSLAMAATASAAMLRGGGVLADEGGLKATGVDHISYRVPDYIRTRDFYADVLGMSVTDDTGTQCELRFGNSMITARNPRQPTQMVPNVDHLPYWIGEWDTDGMKAPFATCRGRMGNNHGEKPRANNYVHFHMQHP